MGVKAPVKAGSAPALEFTSEGFRGIIAKSFTFAAVEEIGRAIAAYLEAQAGGDRGVLLGHDTRFLSEEFAARAEQVLSERQKVVRLPGISPSPLVAFGVGHLGLAAGVMLTASHSPAEYHGIKVFTETGAPAAPEEMEAMMRVRAGDAGANSRAGEGRVVNLEEPYLDAIASQVDVSRIRRAGYRAGLDPMYGAGTALAARLLDRLGVAAQVLHGERDVRFGGHHPEPVAGTMEDLGALVRKEGLDFGLALDGDADRFGVVDETGAFVPQNLLLGALAHHVYANRGMTGAAVRTIATSHFVDAVAAHFQQESLVAPVGFRYVANLVQNRGALLGGEENGAFTLRGHIPSPDGLFAMALFLDFLATENQKPREALDGLRERYGGFYTKRIDLHLPETECLAVMAWLRNEPILEFMGRSLVGAKDLQGVKYTYEGGRWFLVRPATTEPILRVYLESPVEDELPAMEREILGRLNI